MDSNDTQVVSSLNDSTMYDGFQELFLGSIPTRNLKQFALTFQCMAKFGNEMTFEITSNGLLLRVLNDAKTVFLTFRFGTAFFEKYHLRVDNEADSNDINPATTEGKNLKFKALLKPVTAILRSLRTVERLNISFSENSHYSTLTFRMHCARGIVKTHIFQVERTEIYHVVFDRRRDGQNKFLIKPKTLLNILDQIHGAEEIVIRIDRSSARILSHHHNFDESKVAVASEVDIPIAELENRIFNNCPNEGVELIVCLKEIKYFLSYCSAPEIVKHNMNTQVYFDQNGSPMLFSTKGAHRAEMILATVADMNNGDYYNDAEEDEMEMVMPEATKNVKGGVELQHQNSSNKKGRFGQDHGDFSAYNSESTVSFYPQTSSHENMHQNYSSYGQATATTRYNKDNKHQDDNTRSKRKRDVEISDHRRISDNDNNATVADGNLFGEESNSQEDDTPGNLDTTVVVDDDDSSSMDSEDININDKTVLVESMVPSSQ